MEYNVDTYLPTNLHIVEYTYYNAYHPQASVLYKAVLLSIIIPFGFLFTIIYSCIFYERKIYVDICLNILKIVKETVYTAAVYKEIENKVSLALELNFLNFSVISCE